MLILALAAPSFAESSNSKLQWRRTSASSNRSAKSETTTNRIRSSADAPVHTARATQINPLRSNSKPRVDTAVQLAVYEDNGPQFRSVVVDREESEPMYRSAQVSSGGAGAGAGAAAQGAAAPGAASAGDIQTPTDVRGPADATRSVDPSTAPPDFGLPGTDSTDLPPLDDPMDLETPGAQDEPQDRTQLQPGTQAQPGVGPFPGRGTVPGRVPREPVGELPPAPALSESTIEQENQKAAQACEAGLQDLREKTIDKLSLSIAVTGEEGSDFPYECTLDQNAWHGGRCWEQTMYTWKASALCHKPLYFEDEQLERYGHSFSPCFQPFISGAHFFTRPFVLPYCMGVEPPCECIYALGHYRPGNCAPYMCNPIPISPRGALFQAGAVVGTAAAIP